MKLSDFGGEILCEKDAFLCAAYGTSVGIAFQKKFGAGLFGGDCLPAILCFTDVRALPPRHSHAFRRRQSL